MNKPVDTVGGSPERFGYEWGEYSQLDDRYEEQFLRWVPHLSKKDWSGKKFLDVGCGMGRNSYWPMKYGASSGTAVDVDDRSLKSARQTLAPFKDMHIENCSAYELPWTCEFDIVFSVGVIHHLEFPEKALKKMVQCCKKNGKVVIWVYGRENNGWLLWGLNPARKLLLSHLPIKVVHALSILPAALLWVMLRMGLNQLEYFRLLRTFKFSHLRSIVFDQMLPRIANYWRKDEVRTFMEQAGLTQVDLIWVNEMSWAACGRKADDGSC